MIPVHKEHVTNSSRKRSEAIPNFYVPPVHRRPNVGMRSCPSVLGDERLRVLDIVWTLDVLVSPCQWKEFEPKYQAFVKEILRNVASALKLNRASCKNPDRIAASLQQTGDSGLIFEVDVKLIEQPSFEASFRVYGREKYAVEAWDIHSDVLVDSRFTVGQRGRLVLSGKYEVEGRFEIRDSPSGASTYEVDKVDREWQEGGDSDIHFLNPEQLTYQPEVMSENRAPRAEYRTALRSTVVLSRAPRIQELVCTGIGIPKEKYHDWSSPSDVNRCDKPCETVRSERQDQHRIPPQPQTRQNTSDRRAKPRRTFDGCGHRFLWRTLAWLMEVPLQTPSGKVVSREAEHGKRNAVWDWVSGAQGVSSRLERVATVPSRSVRKCGNTERVRNEIYSGKFGNRRYSEQRNPYFRDADSRRRRNEACRKDKTRQGTKEATEQD
ncbi:hypothetical protein K438DRAFT_1788368 [Mycena galopus ATCC 62051]|nr:hypothetical protein K438DRAFT_1788368 [Mycena galopus ATCC 62051]